MRLSKKDLKAADAASQPLLTCGECGTKTLAIHGQRAPGCTAKCNHIDPRPIWDHEAKLEEDRGEIHTDDCGFFQCTHDHDPGDCCTAGQPGVLCRVGLGEGNASDSSPSKDSAVLEEL